MAHFHPHLPASSSLAGSRHSPCPAPPKPTAGHGTRFTANPPDLLLAWPPPPSRPGRRPHLGRGSSLLVICCLLTLLGACQDPAEEEGPTPSETPGCYTATPTEPPPTSPPALCTQGECLHSLRVNEVMAANDGAWVDELGETDDWIEIINTGPQPVSLSGYALSDRLEEPHPLPALRLAAGGVALFWADEDLEQGDRHLPFKLSAEGETVYLWAPDGNLLDSLSFPAMAVNDSYLRLPDGSGEPVTCRFATPARLNVTCGPPTPPALPDDVAFCPYRWTSPWPAPTQPLVINELALHPAAFVELWNTASSPLDLSRYQLRAAAHAPGWPWPGPGDGTALKLPGGSLEPGAYLSVPVTESDVADLAARPGFEGVVTLFAKDSGAVLARADVVNWPEKATLARQPDRTGPLVYCQESTPGKANSSCDPLLEREVGSYQRGIHTPADFAALGAGETRLGVEGVKFLVDLDMGDQVYLLNADDWDLHYTFVREVIEGKPHLDRCDPYEASEFNEGWAEFSEENYFTVEGRRYLLGWLSRYGTNDLHGMEFSTGDVIVASQMAHALFTTVARTLDPTEWYVHAADDRQTAELLSIPGQVPAVGINAPYNGITYQPLNEGVTYGVLQYLPSTALEEATLGPQVIVLTDEVPLDIDLVAGVITEAFQTPLSHVAVLSKNRGTPNMALVDAHTLPSVAPYLGKLVRLEVQSGGFLLREADAEEANAFWEAQHGDDPPQVPALDLEPRGVIPLDSQGLEDLPAIGAKAAQLAELMQLSRKQGAEEVQINTPRDAFAVPVAHYVDHFKASGAETQLTAMLADPTFQADPTVREARLEELRQTVLEYPVDLALLTTLEDHILATFGSIDLRFRSSSNTEDIPGFSGAGLYTSVSGAVGDEEASVENALRTVWASLWNARAFEERAYFGVAQDQVAMAVLCHEAFQSERANGVGISRNVLDPTRSSYYLNVQFGEAAVTNPAPGVTSDELLYRWGIEPAEQYLAYSSFAQGVPVLTSSEATLVATTLKEIHNYFKVLLDPRNENQYFAMDIEFKLLGDSRSLLVKQARPYSYGRGVEDACP